MILRAPYSKALLGSSQEQADIVHPHLPEAFLLQVLHLPFREGVDGKGDVNDDAEETHHHQQAVEQHLLPTLLVQSCVPS